MSSDKGKDGRNWYSYCANNPISNADPSGNFAQLVVALAVLEILEEVADLIGLGMDIVDFAQKPGWDTGLSLTWSAAATILPCLPGSWTLKVAKWAKKGKAVSAESAVLSKAERLAKNVKQGREAEEEEALRILKGQGRNVERNRSHFKTADEARRVPDIIERDDADIIVRFWEVKSGGATRSKRQREWDKRYHEESGIPTNLIPIFSTGAQ